jgi:hypothetical protein
MPTLHSPSAVLGIRTSHPLFQPRITWFTGAGFPWELANRCIFPLQNMEEIFMGLTDFYGRFPNQGTGNSATSTKVITRDVWTHQNSLWSSPWFCFK